MAAGISIVDPDQYRYRVSSGIFYDRNNSLLASLIFNGTDNYLIRANLYPGIIVVGKTRPWVFAALTDNAQELHIGVGLDWLPSGLGISF
jgi:hypothetical protein